MKNIIYYFSGTGNNLAIAKQLKPGIFYKEKYEPTLQQNIASFNTIGKEYTVHDSCAKCGLCSAICPTQNISLKDGNIIFGENCEQCMACIQWCPQKAIDYKGKAASRKRYHHSDISSKDMMQN